MCTIIGGKPGVYMDFGVQEEVFVVNENHWLQLKVLWMEKHSKNLRYLLDWFLSGKEEVELVGWPRTM